MAEQAQQKKRPLSDNESEIAFLKSTFADNEYLLKTIRSLFLGFKITGSDEALISTTFANRDVKNALRKKLYPIISSTDEVGETADFWFGTETEVIGKDPDTIRQIILSKQLVLEYFEKAMELLDNPSGDKINYSFDVTCKEDPFAIRLLARNKFLRSIETALTIVKVISGTREETPEQAKKRLQQDSSK